MESFWQTLWLNWIIEFIGIWIWVWILGIWVYIGGLWVVCWLINSIERILKRSRVAFKPEFNFSRTIEKNWNYICILIFNFIHRFHTKIKPIFSQSQGHADYASAHCSTVLEQIPRFAPSSPAAVIEKGRSSGDKDVLRRYLRLVHRSLGKMSEFWNQFRTVTIFYEWINLPFLG